MNATTSTTAVTRNQFQKHLDKTKASWKDEGIFFRTYKKTNADALEELPHEEREELEHKNKLNAVVSKTFRHAGGEINRPAMDQWQKEKKYPVTIYSFEDWTLIKYRNGTIKLQNESLLEEANAASEQETAEDINVFDF